MLNDRINRLEYDLLKLMEDCNFKTEGENSCLPAYQRQIYLSWDFPKINSGIKAINNRLSIEEKKEIPSYEMYIPGLIKSYRIEKGKITIIDDNQPREKYSLELMSNLESGGELEKNKIYVEIKNNEIEYKVISPKNILETGFVNNIELGKSIPSEIAQLRELLQNFLIVTSKRGHTQEFNFFICDQESLEKKLKANPGTDFFIAQAWYCLQNVKCEINKENINIELASSKLTDAYRAFEHARMAVVKLSKETILAGRKKQEEKTMSRKEKLYCYARKIQSRTAEKLSANAVAQKIKTQWGQLTEKDNSIMDLFGKNPPSPSNVGRILRKNETIWRS